VTEPAAADNDKHDADAEPTSLNAAGSAEADAAAQDNGPAAQPETGAASGGTPASNIMILWPDRSGFSDHAATGDPIHEPQPARSATRRRRRLVLAAVAAIAAVSGAAGGSLATFAIQQLNGTHGPAQLAADADTNARLRDALARVTADLGALRSDFDKAGHARTTQITKLGDRLDKVEKSQDDTTARLTRLNEAQEKLQEKTQDRQRAAAAAQPADVTGSISTPAAAKGDLLKADQRKPQVVEGWTLTRVTNGGAIVSGPDGLYEAYPGDPLPGIGRVDAVRYQDGRWAVFTPKGVIIRR